MAGEAKHSAYGTRRMVMVVVRGHTRADALGGQIGQIGHLPLLPAFLDELPHEVLGVLF